MGRKVLEHPVIERTTIMTNRSLIDRVSTHVKKNGDNQSNFVTRALVNQLEREGDLTIRDIIAEENDG